MIDSTHFPLAEFCLVTDIHIISPEDENYRRLLLLIEKVKKSKVRFFVLLGDIFDFCFGRSKYFHKKFEKLIFSLEELASLGTRVIYVQGNHEFSLEIMPWKRVEILESGSKVLELSNGKKIALCHGDYLLPKKEYFFYMKIVRSELFQTLASFFPAFLMDKICLRISGASKKKKRLLNKDFLKKCSEKWMNSLGADVGFSGHYHMSLEHNFFYKKKEKKMIFVKDWRKAHVLSFDGKEIFSYELH